MITDNDYEKSVLLSIFVKEVRDIASGKESITDVLFTPVIGGYEISFLKNGAKVLVSAEVRGFFTKKLIIRKNTDGKNTATYKAYSKEEISRCAALILKE